MSAPSKSGEPPLNFFDISLINQIADALEEFDKRYRNPRLGARRARQGVLRRRQFRRSGAAGSRGARARPIRPRTLPINHLYVQAVRIFRNKKPIVAAVHGAAIGGGLGLAVVGGFSRHLPRGAVCRQLHQARLSSRLRADRDASRTGRKEQCRIDLLHQPPRDRRGSVADGPCRTTACRRIRCARTPSSLPQEIAECSPLGLLSTRATMRAGLADRVLAATNHELAEQTQAARDRGFQGRRQGHRRAPAREFQGAVNLCRLS